MTLNVTLPPLCLSLFGLQSIAALIKPPVADPEAFLTAHVQKDVEQLTRSLGKGADDAVSTVHLRSEEHTSELQSR